MENAELLYFSIQHPNGETTETTDRADTLRVYEDWCSKYPGTNVETRGNLGGNGPFEPPSPAADYRKRQRADL